MNQNSNTPYLHCNFNYFQASKLWSLYVTNIYIYIYIYVYGCHACVLSHICLFETLWTVACQAPLSMGFSRQEYWSELPFPSPGNLPNPGTEPASTVSPAPQADSLPAEPLGKPSVCMSMYVSHHLTSTSAFTI